MYSTANADICDFTGKPCLSEFCERNIECTLTAAGREELVESDLGKCDSEALGSTSQYPFGEQQLREQLGTLPDEEQIVGCRPPI